MTTETLTRAIVTGLAGAVIGWSASALTLAGRVSAVESTLIRIEAHLDRIEQREKPAAPR